MRGIVRRIGSKFYKELMEIKKHREKLEKENMSAVKMSNLILRHVRWKEIKRDLIKHD